MDKRQRKNWERKTREKAEASRKPKLTYPGGIGNVVTLIEGKGEKGIEYSISNTTRARTKMIENARKKG